MYVELPVSDDDADVSRFIVNVFKAMKETDEVVYVNVQGQDVPAMNYIFDTFDPDRIIDTYEYYGVSISDRSLIRSQYTIQDAIYRYFFDASNIENKYQCSLGDMPTRCVNQWIDFAIEDTPIFGSGGQLDQLLKRIQKLRIAYETEPCMMNGEPMHCLDRVLNEIQQAYDTIDDPLNTVSDIDGLTRFTIRRLVDQSMMYGTGDPSIRCHNDTMPCLQYILETYPLQDVHHEIFQQVAHNYSTYLTPRVFVGRDGTPQTMAEWLLDPDVFKSVGASAFSIFSQYSDIIESLTTTSRNGNEVSVYDTLIDNIHQCQLYLRATDPSSNRFILRILTSDRFDASSERCEHDGHVVPCIAKLLQTIAIEEGDGWFTSFILPETISHAKQPLHKVTCDTRGTSCLEMMLESMNTLGDMEPTLYKSLGEVTSRVLRNDTCGSGNVTCLEHIMSSLRHPDAFIALYGDRMLQRNRYDTAMYDAIVRSCPEPERCRSALYRTVSNHAKSHPTAKTLKVLDYFENCADQPTPEAARECYDRRCFEITNAKQNALWISEYDGRGMEYRRHFDTSRLCGVYDVTYRPASNEEDMHRYLLTVQGMIYALNTALGAHIENVRFYDHITGTAEIVPCYIHIGLKSSFSQYEQDSNLSDAVVVTYNGEDDDRVVRTLEFNFSDILSRLKVIRKVCNNELIAAINTVVTSKPSGKTITLKLVISNRINDIIRASSCQGWESCFNIAGGAYRHAMHSIIDHTTGYIAYLASDEYAPSWLARVYLLPCMDDGKCMTIQKEQRDYAVDNTYAKVLYDAVDWVLYHAGYNDNSCPDWCPAEWADEYGLDSDRIEEGDYLDVDTCGMDEYCGFEEGGDEEEERGSPVMPDGYAAYRDTGTCQYIDGERIAVIKKERGEQFVRLVEKMADR